MVGKDRTTTDHETTVDAQLVSSKMAQETLREKLAEAEQELRSTIAELTTARADAEQANQVKSRFLDALSHELRTPLSSLLINAQLIGRGDVTDDRLRRAARAIERGARMQSQLINDLLDISLMAGGKLKLDCRPVDLAEIARAALQDVIASAESRSIRINAAVAETTAPVHGDALRLQQAVRNLLTNAIKFSADGGEIVLTLELVGQQVKIRISDVGSGIEPEFLPRLFTRFSQESRSSVRSRDGLGLGLSIVRHIVESHGGSVSGESPGKSRGASFSVMIPLAIAGQRPTCGDQSLPERSFRVLVVDDDRELREALLDGLSYEFDVVGAQDGAAALAANPADFDVILLDLDMPVLGGADFTRAIDEEKIPVPVIVMSGERSALAQSAALGAAGFLRKPFEREAVMGAIRTVCRARGAERFAAFE